MEGFSLQDGSSIEKFPIHNAYTSPAIANGFLFTGSDEDGGSVYACELKTGKISWSYDIGSKVRSSPAVADGKLFVGSDDGKIFAFTSAK